MLRHALPVAMMRERGPGRTGLSVWRRSTDQGSATATPAEPRFDAGPPSPPPAHPPGQRRFNFLIVGLTILLAAALVGGLLLYNHYGSSKAVSPPPDAGVKQAYLNFFAATTSALRSLSVTPLQGLVTSAGLKQQQDGIDQAARAGHPFQVTADHDLQVVVYSGGNLASVDDVMSRHTVPLDQTTLAPTGADSPDWLHDSAVLVKQNGHWLVDSVVGFGTDSTEPGSRVSYAAAARGNRLPDQLRTQMQQSYLAYWNATKNALAKPDAALLDRYEMDPKLSQDRLFVLGLIQKGQRYVIAVEHNFRVAQQDDNTVWIYDSLADSSYVVDMSSKQPINRVPVEVTRKSLRFKKVGGQWKLDFDVLNQ